MKKVMLFALAALACGAPEDLESELGQLEQAVSFYPGDFGFNVIGGRCEGGTNVPWGGGQCNVPKYKKFCVYFGNDAGQSPPGAALAPELNAAYTASRNSVKASLGARGYSQTTASEGNCSTNNNHYKVLWKVLPTGTLGRFVPKIQSSDVGNVAVKGQLRKWFEGEIWLDAQQIISAANPFVIGQPTKTAAQRAVYYQNVMSHEMFHAAGLGHAGTTTLMQGAPSNWEQVLPITSFESGMLFDFVGN